MASNALHTITSVEYFTPAPLVEAARLTLGDIRLDPASCNLANQVIRAKYYYSLEYGDNGLCLPWFGPLLVNPPGKSPTNPGGAAAWWEKLEREWTRDFGTKPWSAIYVGFNLNILRTAQKCGGRQPLDFLVCVPKSRIAFDEVVNGERVPTRSPSHDNVIVCLAHEALVARRFRENFRRFGYVGGGGLW